MRPVPVSIAAANAKHRIFFIREVVDRHFSSEFHFHEECQLAYIVQGDGKRIVGDSIESFESGELVFLGSDLPHVWSDNNRSPGSSSQKSISLSLFISPERLIDYLSAFGDQQRTQTLFEKARRGMYITGESKLKICNLLEKATSRSGIEQVITVLEVISLLGSTTEYKPLASAHYTNNIHHRDNWRMNKVYDFLLENFREEIHLQRVADLAGMNPQAFCRFFKSRTQKSLTYFVNEIRIGHACKLLMEDEESISRIAYDSGFNNVSNFNHFFKLVKKVTPREFRRELTSLKYA
jgi:AraC-like DNA-binding protein